MAQLGEGIMRAHTPRTRLASLALLLCATAWPEYAIAQSRSAAPAQPVAPRGEAAGAAVNPDYVIGAGDVLAIRFWRREDVSADVVVRPDGKISLLLLDDIQAAGLRPEQLRDRIVEKANTLFEDARVTVIVKEVNSRTVFITGMVAKPGPYPLRHSLTVMQLIATAGGLLDYANGDRITIVRSANGQNYGLQFNYSDVRSLKALNQNIELLPGDTVVVP